MSFLPLLALVQTCWQFGSNVRQLLVVCEDFRFWGAISIGFQVHFAIIWVPSIGKTKFQKFSAETVGTQSNEGSVRCQFGSPETVGAQTVGL